ncbi:MAG: winged helix-turn-helix domain-containing protein [Blastocatellia bacterium]|nr:winged helix-turn-helix domain-containing protein [Blastocatellia bacterium]
MEKITQASFTVGRFLVQPRLGIISTDETSIRIEPKVMELLVYLAGRAGEVVPKDDILQTVWADTFVTEHVLKVAVSELRKAFGDDARAPKFIQTIPKQGYRLIADVSFETNLAPPVTTPAASKRKSRWLVPSAMILFIIAIAVVWKLSGRQNHSSTEAAPKPIRSVAVLPLKNLSGNAEEEYFAEGMTEALIAGLARTGPLKVISRTSAMLFKDTTKTIPEIANHLDVDAVVEGSVLRSGNRVRIIVQLIDGESDRSIWTQNYERETSDIFSLQNEVASDIARQIKSQLSREKNLVRVKAEAYDAYLKGRFFWNRRDKESLLKSVNYFQQAAQLEPGFAEAYTGLADAYNYLGVFGHAPQDDLYPRAREAALKALELDPDLSEAHAALGFNLMYKDWDWQAAREEFERAIALNPGRAINHHWAASIYSVLEEHETALAEARAAQQLDPLSHNVNGDLGWYYYYGRRFDDAIKQCRRTLELEPSASSMRLCMKLSYELKGQAEEAFAEMEEELKQAGTPQATIESYRRAFAKSGLRGVWGLRIENLERDERRKGRNYQLSVGHALLGDADRAIFWIERAVGAREGWVPFIAADPAFDSLKSDGRFQAIAARLGLGK